MANKKPTDHITLQAKVKVLKKLHILGCKTEADLLSLNLLEVLQVENLTIQDIAIILELQKRVKKHTLFSYLAERVEEKSSINAPPQNMRKEKDIFE